MAGTIEGDSDGRGAEAATAIGRRSIVSRCFRMSAVHLDNWQISHTPQFSSFGRGLRHSHILAQVLHLKV